MYMYMYMVHNLVLAITVNCLYSCFFCFHALSTQQGGYVRATNLYYYYYYIVHVLMFFDCLFTMKPESCKNTGI